jgi:hypothetical protein
MTARFFPAFHRLRIPGDSRLGSAVVVATVDFFADNRENGF